MRHADVAIIGGGQAGLAMSRCLSAAGIDHVVLERDRVAARWRNEANAAGRLLTPNWMTRLPGWRYDGDDPDGFMTFAETGAMLGRYAASFGAPVHERAAVERVSRLGDRFLIASAAGTWRARAVVIATGQCQSPLIPEFARRLSPRIGQIAASDYAGPANLAPGGVLVVGASASGVQIADELALSGRHVVLAAGSHTRLPRRHRGRDIMWWLDQCGILDEATAGSEDFRRPSLQLAGTKENRAPDLPTLAAMGVTIAGRLVAADGTDAVFAGDLAAHCAAAQRRMLRTLGRIEAAIETDPVTAVGGVCPPPAFLPASGPDRIDLARHGIANVIWATGYARAYPWLNVPALSSTGELVQFGGLTRVAGLYALGLSHMRRRKSAFIDGVGQDAQEIAKEISIQLGNTNRRVA